MGGQNPVKVTKGHQVQIFKNCILSSYAKKSHFGHLMRSNLAEVSKSDQVERFMLSFKETEIRLAQSLLFLLFFTEILK